jgi:hypothetical protein
VHNKLECYIKLGTNGLPPTTTLAYWKHSQVKLKMRCWEYGPWSPGLTHKHYTSLERPARGEHSSLLVNIVILIVTSKGNYLQVRPLEGFYSTGPGQEFKAPHTIIIITKGTLTEGQHYLFSKKYVIFTTPKADDLDCLVQGGLL